MSTSDKKILRLIQCNYLSDKDNVFINNAYEENQNIHFRYFIQIIQIFNSIYCFINYWSWVLFYEVRFSLMKIFSFCHSNSFLLWIGIGTTYVLECKSFTETLGIFVTLLLKIWNQMMIIFLLLNLYLIFYLIK